MLSLRLPIYKIRGPECNQRWVLDVFVVCFCLYVVKGEADLEMDGVAS